MKSKMSQYLRSYSLIFLSSVLFGIAFNWFFVPNQISLAGITGVAQILNHWFPPLPIGVAVILLNLPLFIMGWKLLGRHLLISSAFAMFWSSAMVDIVGAIHTFEPMDPMLASIFGGAVVGLTIGIVLLQGATTGGTDLIARLLKLKYAWLPMGRLLLLVDLIVIAAFALVFKSLYSAMYGIIALCASTAVIDKSLYGMDSSKVAYIISEHSGDIIREIAGKLHRGVTILHGAGSYSGESRDILMCAFKQKQIVGLKQAVKEVDPDAFLIVCDAHDVLGRGFRDYDPKDL